MNRKFGIKLDAITQEARLLGTNHIDTAQQLSSYKDGLEVQIDQLTAQRKALYKQQRSVAVKTDEGKATEVKESISKLSSQLATLRREVKLCNDIALRSGIILEHIQMEKAKEQPMRKEKTEHEQRRRCSGTNR